MTLGPYPSSPAAFRTFWRVVSETLAPSVNALETADCDTPASLATSREDAYRLVRAAVGDLDFESLKKPFPFNAGTVLRPGHKRKWLISYAMSYCIAMQ